LLNVEREKVKFVRPRKELASKDGRKKSGLIPELVKPVELKQIRNNTVVQLNVLVRRHQRLPHRFPPALREHRLVESPVVKEQRLYARRDS
jgi:hypothetical protein